MLRWYLSDGTGKPTIAVLVFSLPHSINVMLDYASFEIQKAMLQDSILTMDYNYDLWYWDYKFLQMMVYQESWNYSYIVSMRCD